MAQVVSLLRWQRTARVSRAGRSVPLVSWLLTGRSFFIATSHFFTLLFTAPFFSENWGGYFALSLAISNSTTTVVTMLLLLSHNNHNLILKLH